MTSVSQVLSRRIEQYAEAMQGHPLLMQARAGRVTPATVTEYLAGVHLLVQHTPLHLELARLASLERGATALADHFALKAREEAGHDRWSASDLERMGGSFGVRPRAAANPAIVELLRFLAARIAAQPHAYLSYILLAEQFTVLLGPAWLAALEQECGISMDHLSVVANHVVLDVDHVEHGLQEIDALVSDLELLPIMLDTLEVSIELMMNFFDQLSERAAVAA